MNITHPDNRQGTHLWQFFTSVRAVATLSNPFRIHNGEFDGHVYLRNGPRLPVGPDVAMAAKLRLTADRGNRATPAPAGPAHPPGKAGGT